MRSYIDRLEYAFYKRHIDALKPAYDYVFDFGGKAKENCLKLLKAKYRAEFILYLWDDLDQVGPIKHTFPYFDRKFIFNEEDAKTPGFAYRANFFVDAYRYAGQDKDIDVFYKATARDKSRARVVQAVGEQLKQHRLNVSLFAKGGYSRNFRKVTSRSFFKQWCNQQYLSLAQMAEMTKRAHTLLDIAYQDQKGLGLRPIEAIAANCKLITTNPHIRGYDFYNENNIFLLSPDLSNLGQLPAFLAQPFAPYPEALKRKYSVDGFVEGIFAPNSMG